MDSWMGGAWRDPLLSEEKCVKKNAENCSCGGLSTPVGPRLAQPRSRLATAEGSRGAEASRWARAARRGSRQAGGSWHVGHGWNSRQKKASPAKSTPSNATKKMWSFAAKGTFPRVAFGLAPQKKHVCVKKNTSLVYLKSARFGSITYF